MKMTHICKMGLILSVLAAREAHAQAPPLPGGTSSKAATTVPAAEIQTGLQRNNTGPVADFVLRVLPIDASYNIGISVVRRSKVNGKTPPDAIMHEAITEVYQILEGKGVLVTGGRIESATALPADDPDVRQLIGPSSVGKSILGGTRQRVGPGDTVVIPPHTTHGFVEITTDRIVYTLIRIDPKQLLELRTQPR